MRALVHQPQGLVVIPTGGGKTVIAVAALARIGQPTLIIVHTRDLLEQWVATIKRDLNVDPGIIAQGQAQPGGITVATVQTLMRMDQEQFTELTRQFGCVMVDEAHHTPSFTFQQVVNAIPAKYRYGFTATPERPDGLTPLLAYTFGPTLVSVAHEQLVDEGYLEKPIVRIMPHLF